MIQPYTDLCEINIEDEIKYLHTTHLKSTQSEYAFKHMIAEWNFIWFNVWHGEHLTKTTKYKANSHKTAESKLESVKELLDEV